MRLIASVVGAVLLLLFALAAALPRVFDEAFVRSQLSELSRAATGRALDVAAVEHSLLPPSIVALDTVVGAGSPPFARADRIELRPAIAPLFAGLLVVEVAGVEGAQIRVARTESGFAFASEKPSEAPRTDPPAQTNRVAPSRLLLRGASLSRAEIAIEDLTVEPAHVWQLRNVEARAFADPLESPIRFEFEADFATGGKLVGSGEVVGAEVNCELEFEAVSIAPASAYFAAQREVAGLLTGTLRASGRLDRPRVELRASLRDANLQLGEIGLRGLLEVAARLRGADDVTAGRVEIDATAAELRYAQFFTKPPETPARVTGRLVERADGSLEIDAWEFAMQDLDAQIQPGAAARPH